MLLRTVGFAAGLTMVSAASLADAGANVSRATALNKAETMQATPFWADSVKGESAIIVFPGGDSEFVPQGGVRADPCTLGPANSYDRPPGMAPYASTIVGAFNLDRFYVADDFTPSADGAVNRICWRGWFSNDLCNVDANPSPHRWYANFYEFDGGLPGIPLGSFSTLGGTMTVAQGLTGLPVGINPAILEMSFSATFSSTVSVFQGECYYVELYFESTNPNCFYLMGLSYENTQGNRSMLRRNDRLFPAYSAQDFINLDLTLSVGFTNGSITLAPSNAPGSCFNRPAPPGDTLATRVIRTCNSTIVIDNTYATHDTTLDPYSCRKSTIDIVDYTAGDLWYRVNPNPNTSFSATLCGSNVLGGLAGGDSLMSVFRLTIPANGEILSNLTQIGCSDDACSVGLSQVDAVNLNTLPNGGQNQNFYIRISSFTPVAQGQYTLDINCPVPIPVNDECTGAIVIPANPSGVGFAGPTGIQLNGQTRTATVDGKVRGCAVGAGNTAKGVWYRLTGRGNRVQLSTDAVIAGTAFDTVISVYCGTCDASGSGLACVAFNDDKAPGVPQSELEFCALNGVTYYILIGGFGSATGDFGLIAIETRDQSNQVEPCCAPQRACNPPRPCGFEIPQNARQEMGFNGTSTVAEACVSDGTYTNATQFNDGCSLTPPTGEPRRYDRIQVGETIWGNMWSHAQQRDRDWILFEGLAPFSAGNNTGRTIVQYSFSSEGPVTPRFFNWGALANFQTCSPMLGFVFQNLGGTCFEAFQKVHYFDGTAIGALGQNPGRTFGFLVISRAVGEGYPCGTNTRYWYRLDEAVNFLDCVAVANPIGADFEETVPTFDGTGGEDGNLFGELCIDPPGAGARRKRGCGVPAATRTNGDFLRITPNVPLVGKVDGTVGAQGGSRDIDYYKFTLSGPRQKVTLSVESAGVMTSLITNDDCTADAVTYAIAATRGTCISNSATAEDVVVLEGGGTTYLVYVFSTDAFLAIGSGALFANYLCDDAVTKYVVTVGASALPDCSGDPICPSPTENEPCVTIRSEMFKDCAPDNDGCSESVYGADSISSGTPVCGTLFSVYNEDADFFFIDVDYYQFTVTANTKATFRMRADADAFAQLIDVGPGGSNCYNFNFPVRVLASQNAGSCSYGADRVVYLTPGTYALVANAGNTDQGFSDNDYRCPNVITYAMAIDLEPVGSCCIGNDCVVVTASECSMMGGSGWTSGQTCGPTYSAGPLSAHSFVSIIGQMGTSQVMGLGDDDVVTSNMAAPFTYYGVTYSPSQIGIGSNGYIVFGNTDVGVTARSFPNTAVPNAMAAPFFHDWDINAPGASVHIRNFGPLGSETTIVEWNNVGRHFNFAQRATFQIVLKRPSMEIEFRYGNFSAAIAKLDVTTLDGTPITASAGLEDATGLDGVNIDLTGSFLTGNKSISFSRTDTPCFVAVPPCCPGNADKISPGAVAFADITAVLSVFGNPANPNGTSVGDANCDGFINFADITSVLSNFGNSCP